jgi:hypothetical protein
MLDPRKRKNESINMKPIKMVIKEWQDETERDRAAQAAYWAEYKDRVLKCPHCGETPGLFAYMHKEAGPYAAVMCCSEVAHYGGSIEASVMKAFHRWNRRV